MDSLFEVAASSSRNVEKSEEIVVSSSSDDKENCFLNPHHHQTQNQKTITASSRLSLQRLATLPKRTLARGLLQKRRILAVLESCRKEREVIAAIKAGEFNQLLNLADVDNKQQNLQSKTLSSSSLYDFEMNQLLYFTKHSSVASLLADPLLKPIRWPADENDPQQKMLWHIYELLGKEEGDDGGGSVKIEPKEEENEVKQLQTEDLYCSCGQTSSSSPTDLDTTSVDQQPKQQQLSSPPNKMGSSKKKAKLSSSKKKKDVSSSEKRTLENLEASPRARRRRRRLVEPVLPSLTIEEDEQSKAKKEKKARREHRKLHRMGKKTKKMKKEGKASDLGVFTTTSSPAPSTLIAAAE